MTIALGCLLLGGLVTAGVAYFDYGGAKKEEGKMEVVTEIQDAEVKSKKEIQKRVRRFQTDTYSKKQVLDKKIREDAPNDDVVDATFELLQRGKNQ